MELVPIGRADRNHLRYSSVLVQNVEGRARPRAPRNDDRRARLEAERRVHIRAHTREEYPIQKAHNASRRMRVIDRRTKDKSVRFRRLRDKTIHLIRVERALLQLAALAARHAVHNRLRAQRDNLRLDLRLRKDLCHLFEP